MAGSTTLVRARNEFGEFIGDDPSTLDVNEAWVEVPALDDNDNTTAGEV